MTAYMILQISVTDPETMARYRDAVAPLIATHGGKSIARGIAEVLEGDEPSGRLSIFEFPSMDALRGFWDSPEYEPVKKIRQGAAKIDVWAVETAASG